jgi:phage gpG-like protein
MIEVSFDDRELQGLLKKLAKYGDDQATMTEQELDASAIRIESEAKRRVPVDTGRLRSSIHIESARHSRRELGVQPGELEVYVGTNVEYAHQIHSRGGKGEVGKQFLFVPAEAERVQLIRRLKNQLQKV